MDSQHRHELKTNELAEGLSHLPQILKDNVNTILGIILIVAGLISWPIFNNMKDRNDKTEQAAMMRSIQMLDMDVFNVLQTSSDDPQAQSEALNTLLVNADALLGKASGINNSNLSAMAQIKAAQAIRTELHLRKEVSTEMLESQIQKAKNAYQEAFVNAETATLKGMAQFGLALCSEELGQTEQAAEVYRQIVEDESFKPTVLPKQAQHRLDTMADNIEVFNFAAVPVVIEETVEQSVEPVTVDTIESTVEPATDNTTDIVDTEKPVEEAAESNTENP